MYTTLGKSLHDRWQRVEDVFDTFVWREKAEGKQDRAPLRPKFVLVIVRIGKRHVRDAVRDQINLVHRRFVNVAKKLNTLFGHGHDARRKFDHFLEHQLLFARGIAQDRMQGGDHRHSEISQQRQQMAAARASKDSEFVLQAEDIDVNQIQKIGRPPVCGDILFRNFETHFGRIVVSLRAIGHRDNRTVQARVLRGDRLRASPL